MTNRPNILLIMTDQQRYDSLGCYGFEAACTPNLDQLAADGVLFERDYVNNPVCTPSRASMFTGKHLPGHGVYRLYDNLADGETLFTRYLQDIGYQTALFGKLHVSSTHCEAEQRHPNDGFDVYEWCLEGCLCMDSPYQAYAQWLRNSNPEFYDRMRKELRGVGHVPRQYHMTHWAAERTISFIDGWNGNRPFFCMMSIFDPHNPYDGYPLEMEELVDVSKIPDPLIREDGFEGRPAGLRREHHGSYLGDFDKFSMNDLRKMRQGYHVAVAFADIEIGRVLAALERRGIADNTLVIFTSDHGDMLGDHCLLVKGAFFYDPCTRVPLIMRWPARFGVRRRVPALVQNHDLAATILAAAGVDEAAAEKIMPESRDLIPLAAGEVKKIRDHAVCCYRNSGICSEPTRTPYFDPPIHATMIRDERHKLNIWHDARGNGQETEGELYDLNQDPFEVKNLWHSPQHRDIRLALTDQLLDCFAGWERSLGRRGGESLPPPGKSMKNALK